jgi:hypothetical protein
MDSIYPGRLNVYTNLTFLILLILANLKRLTMTTIANSFNLLSHEREIHFLYHIFDIYYCFSLPLELLHSSIVCFRSLIEAGTMSRSPLSRSIATKEISVTGENVTAHTHEMRRPINCTCNWTINKFHNYIITILCRQKISFESWLKSYKYNLQSC